MEKQIFKLGGVAAEGIKINPAKDTVYVALFAVLPKMPVAVDPGFFFLQVVGYP